MWNLFTTIFGRTTSQQIFHILIVLVILYIIVAMYGYHKRRQEGFRDEQGQFMIKRQQDIYDSYYANVYNKIYEPIVIAKQVTEFMTSFTKSSPQSSILLDIGVGTGELMAYLQSQGFVNVYGIEESKEMIEYALTKYPNAKLKQGNVLQPMIYDGSTFTHILCTGFHNVLYHLKPSMKKIFFQNCYHWLQANQGYLILQLYERDEFNPIPPGGIPSGVDNPQKYSDVRITKAEVNYQDLQYHTNYDFSKTDCVTVTESFVENKTNNVRKNEFELYIDDIATILQMAKQAGFTVRGQVDVNIDHGQHLYLLEKIL